MSREEELTQIWESDKLGRRYEASRIEAFLEREVKAFEKLGRDQSLVLAVDAPYGRGKTWFLQRLARQLAQSHPVAFIDAWADDVGDEPLTAFMAAIDDALEPYIARSKRLGDRMAAAKAAALPVMGKLVSGALIKALSKVAGDEIEEQLGDAVEQAVRGAKQDEARDKDGAAALAMEAAFTELGKEIDSLVDRRGAAMLAAYRQRRSSRSVFQRNMRELVSVIDESAGPGRAPLIVIIDELDRCRPSYAIKMLEEIKHFFEIPRVVFIIGLHGDQLACSIKAVYGSEFASDEYLRRFFTRRYTLREHNIVELAVAIFEESGIDERKFKFPDPTPTVAKDYALTNARTIGLILSQWNVTPREIYPIMDGLRLFSEGWEHAEPIEPIAILCLLVKLVRGQQFNFHDEHVKKDIQFAGTSWNLGQGTGKPAAFSITNYLAALTARAWGSLREIQREQPSRDSAQNYVIEWLQQEWRARQRQEPLQSHFADYIPRVVDLARFIEEPPREQNPDRDEDFGRSQR